MVHEEMVGVVSLINKQKATGFGLHKPPEPRIINDRTQYCFEKNDFLICPATMPDNDEEHAVMLLKDLKRGDIYFFNSNAISKDGEKARTYMTLEGKGYIPLNSVSIQGVHPTCSVWTLAATIESLKCESLEQILESFKNGEMYARILRRFSAIEDSMNGQNVSYGFNIPTEEIGTKPIYFAEASGAKFLSQNLELRQKQQMERKQQKCQLSLSTVAKRRSGADSVDDEEIAQITNPTENPKKESVKDVELEQSNELRRSFSTPGLLQVFSQIKPSDKMTRGMCIDTVVIQKNKNNRSTTGIDK
ncbi:MAG: hypothetical protein LBG48_05735, partial [Rickettsiales bacterium]|jgi:hypothetical protein|nr:hypothetical protein [Rickettsiales bacterium]